MAEGSVFIDIIGDSSNFKKSLRDVEESAKASLLSTEMTAKQITNSISSAFTRMAGIVGVALGIGVLVNYARESIMLASRIETLGIVIREVGKNAGYTKAEMDFYVESIKKNGITTQAAMDSVTKMAQAQLDLTKASKLARISQDAAVIGNTNSSEAFQRMIWGIKSGQTEILRTMGLNVNFEQSYSKLATQLNKNAASLNESEKTQARMNEVLEYGIRIQGVYEASLGAAGKQMQSMKRYVEELQLGFGELFGAALKQGVFDVSDLLKAMNKDLDQMKASGVWEDWGRAVSGPLRVALEGIWNIFKSIWNIIQPIAPLLTQLAGLFGAIGYGLGGVLAIAVPISKAIANAVMFAADLVALLGTGVTMLVQIATGQVSAAKASWEMIKNIYGTAKDRAAETLDLLTSGTSDAIMGYQKTVDAATVAAKKKSDAEKLEYETRKKRADEYTARVARGEIEALAEANKIAQYKKKMDEQTNQTSLTVMKNDHKNYYEEIKHEQDLHVASLKENGSTEIEIAQYVYDKSIELERIKTVQSIKEANKESANRKAASGDAFNSAAFMEGKMSEITSAGLTSRRAANLALVNAAIADRAKALTDYSAYYKTINEYSRESYEAEFDLIYERAIKLREGLDRYKFIQEEMKRLNNTRNQAQAQAEISYYNMVDKYSINSFMAQKELWRIEAEEVEKKSQGRVKAAAYVAQKEIEYELNKVRDIKSTKLSAMGATGTGPDNAVYIAQQNAVFAAEVALEAKRMEQLKVTYNAKEALAQKEMARDLQLLESKKTFYESIIGYEEKALEAAIQAANKKAELEKREGKDPTAVEVKRIQTVEKAQYDAQEKVKKNIEDQWEMRNKDKKLAITNAKQVFENASSLFDKESKEYKLMQDLKKVAILAEMAMELQKNVAILTGMWARAAVAPTAAIPVIAAETAIATAGAAGSVATAGMLPPPFGFASAAAMLAIMVGVLGMAGIAFGGGGGGSSAAIAPAYGQNTTVLGGANNQGSESVTKGWELLQDTYDMEYEKLTKIYNEMKDLNRNITGLATAVIRRINVGGTGVDVGTTQGSLAGVAQTVAGLATMGSAIVIAGSAYMGTIMASAMASPVGWAAMAALVLDKVLGLGIVDKAVGWLVGGSTTSVTGGGLQIAGQGKNVRGYTSTQTESSGMFGGLFGGGGTSASTSYGAIDETLVNLISGPKGIYTGIKKSLEWFAENLGTDTSAAINYAFADVKIDLRGLTGDQIQKKLSEEFSRIADVATETLFGSMIAQYQEINEGLFETATRLIVSKEIILSALEMTNKAFSGTAMEAVVLSQSLIEIAGSLDALTEAASTYYDAFFSDAEKQARLQNILTEELASSNMVLPKTRKGYRDLVEVLDLTKSVHQEAYIVLMKAAGAADEYYSALEDAADVQDQVTQGLRDQSQTITQWISDMNRSTLSPATSKEAIINEYQRLKGLASAEGATSADTSNFLSYAQEYLTYMRAYGGDYKAIFDEVMGDASGLKTGIDKQIALAEAQLSAILGADLAARVAADALLSAMQLAAAQAAADKVIADTAAKDAADKALADAKAVADAKAKAAAATAVTFVYPSEQEINDMIFGKWEGNAGGGYASKPTIYGEAGGEWAVPTYEPERSSFLRRAPESFWKNLGVGGDGGSQEITIVVPITIDGNVLAETTAKYIPRNSNLNDAIRRVH